MKNNRIIISSMLTVLGMLLLFTFSLPVSALAPKSGLPEQEKSAVIYQISEESISMQNSSIQENSSIITIDKEQQKNDQSNPIQKKNTNTPFFIGAILAVLGFIGVAVVCKIKGNQ